MVKYKEDSIYIIGGEQNNEVSKKCWIINPVTGSMIQGPPLNYRRRCHSCAIMESNGKFLIVVAGGFQYFNADSESYLDTVELLDPSSDQGWIIGSIILQQPKKMASEARFDTKYRRYQILS